MQVSTVCRARGEGAGRRPDAEAANEHDGDFAKAEKA
jgi:hypothetical protein